MGDTCDCISFSEILNESVIFQELCYEKDFYKRDSLYCQSGMMINKKNQHLVIDEKRFQFETLNNEQLKSPDGNFIIQLVPYKSNADTPLAVTISIQGCTVVCMENKIQVKPQSQIPDFIEGEKHEAIFYKHQISGKTNLFKFESSLISNCFLGFDTNASPDELLLVLRNGEESVDSIAMKYNTTSN